MAEYPGNMLCMAQSWGTHNLSGEYWEFGYMLSLSHIRNTKWKQSGMEYGARAFQYILLLV